MPGKLERVVARNINNAPRELIEDACANAWTILLRRDDITLDVRGFSWLTTVVIRTIDATLRAAGGGASIVRDDRALPTPGLPKEVRRMARPFVPGAAVLAAGVGAAFLAKRLASKRGGRDFGQMIERMPEGSPPRWVFDNVTAVRKNTDRILELLEGRPTWSGATGPPVETPPPA